MKTYFGIFFAFLGLVCGTGYLWGAPSAANPPAPSQLKDVPAPTPYAVTKRDANSRLWQRTVYEKAPNGRVISKQLHYTELASGLHYKNDAGQWVESKEYIEAYATGAIARQGQYQVIFANNLNSAGAIDIQAPDGKRLRSNILGLGYYDSATGQSVLIASLQDSQGELIADNVVLYPNAFEGVRADVRYTYKIGSFEQDVILQTQPPAPEQFGLHSDSTELEVITEFLNPPKEAIRQTADKFDHQADQDVSWGAMRLGHGKAFDLSEGPSPKSTAQVLRQYVTVDGRKILVEKVRLPDIKNSLSNLPRQASLNANLPKTASQSPLIPKAPLARIQQKPMKLAARTLPNKGYMLDYVVLNTDQSNYTFKADEGYRVKGLYSLAGVITFEGGTVIKCNQEGQINIDSSCTIICKTSAYRPAVFTSNNDDGIGAPGYWMDYSDTDDPYYTGTPSLGDVNTFLNFSCSNPVLRNMRFGYANQAITVNSSAGNIDLWDCQFMNIHFGVLATDVNVGLHNVLINEAASDYPIKIYSSGNLTAENVTCDGFGSGNGVVYFDNPGFQTAMLTNTIVTAGQYISVNGGSFVLSADPFYQVVGGGSYYLTNNSPYRNVGTTNISPALLVELRQKTTFPPFDPYLNTTISTNTTLSPQAGRDTDIPDLGYHYDPLDYVFGGCDLTANLTVSAGTAVGFYDDYGAQWYPHGLTLSDGANLTITGTANAPCWMARYDNVQEGGNGNWPITPWQGIIVFNGSGATPLPQLNASFSKWPAMYASECHFQDAWTTGVGRFNSCEFFGPSIGSYQTSYYFTNCLFFRVATAYWSQVDAANFTYQNCTFYNGFLAMVRNSWQSPSFWTIKDTMFDGTGFLTVDDWGGATDSTYFDYNAYNTNNTSWATYNSGYWSDPALETIGAHDVIITNLFTWQSSWLGDFYQPTDSQLVDAGSATADNFGLYHFTIQTSQVKETNSIVDVGYHYVATDIYGNPLDSNGNGIPDYMEDTSGVGQSLTVTLLSPLNNAAYSEPATIPIQATVFDWRSMVTNVIFFREETVQIAGFTNAPYTDSWPIVAAGAYSLTAIAKDAGGISATSAPVNITVTNMCGF